VKRDAYTGVTLSAAKNLIQWCVAGAIASKAASSWWSGAGAWMRFFVAEGAPQNDGGFWEGLRIVVALRAGSF
jgi:hypothetical protein